MYRKWRKGVRLWVAIGAVLLVTYQSGHAAPCSPAAAERAEQLTAIAAQKIVGEYGGGRSVSARMTDCQLSESEILTIQIGVSWNGILIKRNEYAITGELRTFSDGSKGEFHQAWSNENVQRLKFFKSLAGGAIMSLGALK